LKAGESTLVELNLDGEKIPVLFKDVDRHVVSEDELHVDFYAVNMKEEIETPVPVKLTGESPAVKDQSAILITPMQEVTVRCLPANLPHALEVSIASLKEFGDVLTIKDVSLPKGVAIMEAEEAVIATVQEPRKEEVIEVATPAEGEAPAAGADGAVGTPEAAAKEGEVAAK
jgi:large subunit ribosomal protein L25